MATKSPSLMEQVEVFLLGEATKAPAKKKAKKTTKSVKAPAKKKAKATKKAPAKKVKKKAKR